jgi:hypothetical protein
MKIEESVESMREVYTTLFGGLQAVKSYIDFTDEPASSEDEGVRSQELEMKREESEAPTSNSSILTPNSSNTKQRIFRRR